MIITKERLAQLKDYANLTCDDELDDLVEALANRYSPYDILVWYESILETINKHTELTPKSLKDTAKSALYDLEVVVKAIDKHCTKKENFLL